MPDGVTPIVITKEQPGFVKTPWIENIINRALVYSAAGFPINFTGPAGWGKSCLAMYVAGQIGRPVVIIHGDDELGTSDIVGGNYGFRRKKTVDRFIHAVKKSDEEFQSRWVDNRLTVACKHGYTLIYDEFTRSRAEANNALLSVLEEKTLDMPAGRDQEGFIRVNPNFTAIFTSNPSDYAGVHRAQDALMDRMINIKLGQYDRDTEIAITVAKSGVAKADAEKIVDLVRAFRAEHQQNGHAPTIRAGIMIGKVLKAYGIHAKASDKNFIRTCVDVLDSPETNGDGRIQKIVGQLAKQYAGDRTARSKKKS